MLLRSSTCRVSFLGEGKLKPLLWDGAGQVVYSGAFLHDPLADFRTDIVTKRGKQLLLLVCGKLCHVNPLCSCDLFIEYQKLSKKARTIMLDSLQGIVR